MSPVGATPPRPGVTPRPTGAALLAWYTCGRKRRYTTEADALAQLDRPGIYSNNAYLCGDHWHIGQRPSPALDARRRTDNARRKWRQMERHAARHAARRRQLANAA